MMKNRSIRTPITLMWLSWFFLLACRPAPLYKQGVSQSAAFSMQNDDRLRTALLNEIEAWKGTPYRYGMVERGKGTDCSGFVQYVVKKIYGIDLPRQTSEMAKYGRPVEKKNLRFGDLVFFQNTYRGAKGASHVGLYIGNNRFVHAEIEVGVTISDLNEKYYRKHYRESRRILKD